MGKEEKLSFSFSSKSRPNPSKGPQPFDNQEPTDVSSSKPQFVTAFDPSQTLDSAAAPKLVIAPIPNYDFRSRGIKRMKNLALPSDDQHPDPESTRFVVDDSDSTAPADNISFGLTLRSKNASAAASDDSDYKQEDITLKRFREDMKSLPDDRGMDEFKDVPVEGFAAAILAGYGWSEGKGIGRKNKGDTKVVQYDRRAGTAGLGYKPSVNDNIVKVQKGREKSYTLNKNAKSSARTVRIISGQYFGLKAEVLKVVDGSELVLKLMDSGEKVRLDEGRVAELGSDADERCLRKLELEISDKKEKKDKRRVKDRKEGHSSDRRDARERSPVRWLRSHIRVRIISKDECSVLSCAWNAPRVLTGALASTSLPQCSLSRYEGRWPRRRSTRLASVKNLNDDRYEDLNVGKLSYKGHADFAVAERYMRSHYIFDFNNKWKLFCSPFSECSGEISPDSLWEDLSPAISYLAPEELKLVNDALKLAFEAHNGQKRRSGEPFIIHPVEVAHILGELELDWESIAAGLLHDTVEDTSVTFERIEKEFGVTVRHIVEGETKVSKLGKLKCKDMDNSVQDVKADDLRQMFLAMTEEVRVIIVKLADRLHNMRTLSHMPKHKQSSIALETLQVFAPLAKLLGMYQIKSELEYLSFMYTKPRDFSELKKRVEDLYKEHEKELLEAKKILKERIEKDQFLELVTVKTEVRTECKELYSIYKALLKSKSSIKEVNQIAQLRIIIKPKTCIGGGPLCNTQQICYHVLGLVHGIWTPIPRAMKDYIATPKPNGYQSLHTTVIPFLYESMFRLEVQIRTEDMDMIAEKGIAAHYSGRGVVSGVVGHGPPGGRSSKLKTICLNNTDIALRIGWLNAIREWQEEFVGNMSSREFVDTVMRDLLGSRVFVFTPKGEIKNLPKGATVIDYAYLIHTEIGNKMVAAKVNGNLVSPMHALANAEVVEIITYNALSSKSAFQRHQQWLQHAKTRSARHKIMKFLREQAALSASEITADTVNNFVADLVDQSNYEEKITPSSKERKSIWDKILGRVDGRSTLKRSQDGLVHIQNSIGIHKVNGNHNKNVQKLSLKINGHSTIKMDNIAEFIHANIPMYKEVLPGLESWKASKIVSWHGLEGHSIQWFCVVCIDRRGMMAEVTSALTAVGLMICSCVAEIDRRKGIGVLLFHIEGNDDNLVNACSSVDAILGVLGWSAGCSWSDPPEDHTFHEC